MKRSINATDIDVGTVFAFAQSDSSSGNSPRWLPLRVPRRVFDFGAVLGSDPPSGERQGAKATGQQDQRPGLGDAVRISVSGEVPGPTMPPNRLRSSRDVR